VATHGNRFGAHGKEGVNGSSPSEGFTKVSKCPFLLPHPRNLPHTLAQPEDRRDHIRAAFAKLGIRAAPEEKRHVPDLPAYLRR
jgi:hypothetical protein